jgi:hypothetical protein
MSKVSSVPPPSPKQAAQKRDTRFKRGQSGNPAGKPKGTRNRATLAMEALLEGEAEALTRKGVELALAGDTTALRLCFERILPARKDRPVTFALPTIETAADAAKATAALVAAVAAGELTPTEASELSRLLENFTRVLVASEFEERLTRLEGKANETRTQ